VNTVSWYSRFRASSSHRKSFMVSLSFRNWRRGAGNSPEDGMCFYAGHPAMSIGLSSLP
jgi:hypothetical protein